MRTPADSAAWFLVALFRAAGATTPKAVALRALIASADSLNHAVISHAEFESALSLLLAGDLVTYVGESFSLTESGARLLGKCGAHESPQLHSLPRVASELARLPPAEFSPVIPGSVFAEAVASYAIDLPHPLWSSRNA